MHSLKRISTLEDVNMIIMVTTILGLYRNGTKWIGEKVIQSDDYLFHSLVRITNTNQQLVDLAYLPTT